MGGSRRFFLMFFLVFCGFFSSQGQQVNCKWISVDLASEGFILDSLSVVEQSIWVKDNHDRPLPFKFSLTTNRISIEADSTDSDAVEIGYTTLPYSLHKVYSKSTLTEEYDFTVFFQDYSRYSSGECNFKEDIFPNSNLIKSGIVARGISFVNTENVFVTSSLNLQREGQLTDDLNIRASITDQNLTFK